MDIRYLKLEIVQHTPPYTPPPPLPPSPRTPIFGLTTAHDAVCEFFPGKFFWFKKEDPIWKFFYREIFWFKMIGPVTVKFFYRNFFKYFSLYGFFQKNFSGNFLHKKKDHMALLLF
jgi:hypothetical protein